LAVEAQIVPAAGDEPPVPTGAARARFLAALRAAHADDLLIGVLMKTGADRQTVDRGELAELVRLTAASPDPWMQLIGVQQQAEAARRDHDLVGAEAILLRGRQRCAQPGAPAYRCITIGRLLGRLYLDWQRLPEARAVLGESLQLARRAGEWISLGALLEDLASLAALSDEIEAASLPLVRAYVAEAIAWMPADPPDGRCARATFGRMQEAMLLIDRLEFAQARRALAGPACVDALDAEGNTNLLHVRGELIGHDSTPAELAALRADIAALRASPALGPAQRIELDQVEGRAIIDREPAAGEALLRRAITAAAGLPSAIMAAHKAAGWSYSILVSAAARRGDGDRALALLGEEQGVAVPARCVLGLAVEDEHRTIVVRDAAGKTINHADAGRTTPAIDAARFVPAAAVGELAGCAVVDVIARAPLHGRSRLLPDAVAWRYLSQRARPVAPASDRALTVADVEPPAALDLPRLASWGAAVGGERLAGPDATPTQVLAAIGRAGEVVIDAHGMVDVAQPDASFLALSPEPDGRYALTTGDVRAARFTTSPLVILAACHSSHAAPTWHTTWSLPAAFIFAGARVVIASTAPIPDGDARAFFDAVRAGMRAGAAPAAALRDVRQQWAARADWVRDVIVFE
ncbi:MAG TPA: CHAT domain-containing protein, partial [Kofleriaceae bacterium]|nr:CHAT domain-containing protein [Kofleriaceae bacterium]